MPAGSAILIRKWGRPATLIRDGVTLASFKARRAEIRPDYIEMVNSVIEDQFILIVVCEDLGDVGIPRKFDKINYNGDYYTVTRAHAAGGVKDEFYKITVVGGNL